PVIQTAHNLPPGVTVIEGSPFHFLSLGWYVSSVELAIFMSKTPDWLDQKKLKFPLEIISSSCDPCACVIGITIAHIIRHIIPIIIFFILNDFFPFQV